MPDDASFLQYLGKHCVAITWHDAKEGEARASSGFVFSAFVMSIRGIWFLVSAGHIIEDINARQKAGRTFKHSEILDIWGEGAQNRQGIPFPGIHMLAQGHIYDPERGVDYAIIYLSEYYREQLRANNIVPLDESYWSALPQAFDGYNVFGFPANKNFPRYDDANRYLGLHIGPTIYPYSRAEPLPEIDRVFPRHFFHPPRGEDGRPISVDGMSGGPIFGYKENTEGIRMWLVAVQSQEFKGIAIGCPIAVLGEVLRRAIDKEVEIAKSSPDGVKPSAQY